jgi:hypothetical protein
MDNQISKTKLFIFVIVIGVFVFIVYFISKKLSSSCGTGLIYNTDAKKCVVSCTPPEFYDLESDSCLRCPRGTNIRDGVCVTCLDTDSVCGQTCYDTTQFVCSSNSILCSKGNITYNGVCCPPDKVCDIPKSFITNDKGVIDEKDMLNKNMTLSHFFSVTPTYPQSLFNLMVKYSINCDYCNIPVGEFTTLLSDITTKYPEYTTVAHLLSPIIDWGSISISINMEKLLIPYLGLKNCVDCPSNKNVCGGICCSTEGQVCVGNTCCNVSDVHGDYCCKNWSNIDNKCCGDNDANDGTEGQQLPNTTCKMWCPSGNTSGIKCGTEKEICNTYSEIGVGGISTEKNVCQTIGCQFEVLNHAPNMIDDKEKIINVYGNPLDNNKPPYAWCNMNANYGNWERNGSAIANNSKGICTNDDCLGIMKEVGVNAVKFNGSLCTSKMMGTSLLSCNVDNNCNGNNCTLKNCPGKNKNQCCADNNGRLNGKICVNEYKCLPANDTNNPNTGHNYCVIDNTCNDTQYTNGQVYCHQYVEGAGGGKYISNPMATEEECIRTHTGSVVSYSPLMCKDKCKENKLLVCNIEKKTCTCDDIEKYSTQGSTRFNYTFNNRTKFSMTIELVNPRSGFWEYGVRKFALPPYSMAHCRGETNVWGNFNANINCTLTIITNNNPPFTCARTLQVGDDYDPDGIWESDRGLGEWSPADPYVNKNILLKWNSINRAEHSVGSGGVVRQIAFVFTPPFI